MTYTFVDLAVSRRAFDEIATKLREAKYDHCFHGDDQIDMHGLALVPDSDEVIPTPAEGAPTREKEIEKCGNCANWDWHIADEANCKLKQHRVTRNGWCQSWAPQGPREDASHVPPMRMLAGLLDCAKCGFSAGPAEILDVERKHFWNHAYRCLRCLYQSAGGHTWEEAKAEWNRRAGKLVTETGTIEAERARCAALICFGCARGWERMEVRIDGFNATHTMHRAPDSPTPGHSCTAAPIWKPSAPQTSGEKE